MTSARGRTYAPAPTQPLIAPLYTAAVYRCETTSQADALLGGELAGYAYLHDGHPNADIWPKNAANCTGASGAICSSGVGRWRLRSLSQLMRAIMCW